MSEETSLFESLKGKTVTIWYTGEGGKMDEVTGTVENVGRTVTIFTGIVVDAGRAVTSAQSMLVNDHFIIMRVPERFMIRSSRVAAILERKPGEKTPK